MSIAVLQSRKSLQTALAPKTAIPFLQASVDMSYGQNLGFYKDHIDSPKRVIRLFHREF